LLAGTLTTACWLPQLARSWRTRSTRDLSWGYLVVLAVGVALWLVYGVLRDDVPLVLTNMVTLCFLILLIVIKAIADLSRPVPERTE
jgi:MtN3 and saliva related transmembrane protein